MLIRTIRNALEKSGLINSGMYEKKLLKNINIKNEININSNELAFPKSYDDLSKDSIDFLNNNENTEKDTKFKLGFAILK